MRASEIIRKIKNGVALTGDEIAYATTNNLATIHIIDRADSGRLLPKNRWLMTIELAAKGKASA